MPGTGCLIAVFLGLSATPVRAQTGGTIAGQVTDARTQTPVAGATIEIGESQLRGTAGPDGRYRINNVPAGTHAVSARRIGFAVLRQTVSVSNGVVATADFALQVSAAMLDEVVVTGTAGGEQRRSIGNAVSRIDASAELDKSSATNVTSLLNARSPGLLIVPATGRLGSTPAIQIRGKSSLSLSNSPLVYIDGIRVNNSQAVGPTGSGGLASQNSQIGGRMNDINPDDIESIEVISGPAAATIYGTEAAAGVIQIITKKGAFGGNVQTALQASVGSMYFRDAAGRVPTNYAKDKTTGNIVAWNGVQAEADSGRPIFKTGLSRQYNGSFSGGSQVRYYVSSAFENDYGIEPNNSLRQFNTHANISAPIGTKSDFSTSLNYVNQSAHLGVDNGASALLGAEVGHPVAFGPRVAGGITLNPRGFYPGYPPEVFQTLYDNADGLNRFTGSATLNNRPVGWFTQRAVLGLDYSGEDARAIERFAPANLAPYLGAAATGRIGQTLRRNTLISADYNGTAKTAITSTLGSTFSVGGQFYNSEANSSFLGGIGFPAPDIETVSATAQPIAASQTQTINTTIGAYAQEQISWRDRLFVAAAARVDNNSAFGDKFKWVTYPKVSASWVVNEEPFWKWTSINSLRLRTAYGESGRQPASFSALRVFNPVTGPGGSNAITPGSIGNADLKPERGKELELGLESELFNRLSLNVTYYTRKTTDDIINQAVAPSSGFSGTRVMNLGRVDNHGLEVSSTLQALTRRDMAWEITGNVGTNKDVIKDLGNVPSLITAAGPANVVGYPIGGIWTRRVVSADRDATTGFATNVLCDGGAGKPAVACASGAFVYLGTTTPGLTGSIGNTVTIHKNLRLYALLDFKRGYIEQSTTELLRCTGATGTALCRQNYYPQEFSPLVLAEAVVGAATQGYQDYYYQSGNFVKLREVSATYTIPQKWARGFSRASFTLAARELHTWTKFHGLDPEAYYYLSTSPINGSDQAILPPLSRIIGTFNLAW
jgi:TonB-linked SusC/RagA family outer membrane protein